MWSLPELYFVILGGYSENGILPMVKIKGLTQITTLDDV